MTERDLEIAELRRAVELLQRQLEQQQNNANLEETNVKHMGRWKIRIPLPFVDDSSDEDRYNEGKECSQDHVMEM